MNASVRKGVGTASRLALVGVFLGGLWSGLRDGDHLLIWSSLFVLLTFFWGALTVVLTGLVLRRAMSRTVHPKRLEGATEITAMTGWHCSVPRWVPLNSFTSNLNGHPTSFLRQGRSLSEVACFPRRRLEEGLVREFVISDFLGMSSWSFQDRRAASIRILPTVGSRQGLVPLVGVVAGADLPDPYSAETGDRLDMRRYRKGDPLRLVLWNIYQRSGHLMVRAPEKAVSQHQRTGLYLLCSPQDFPAAKLARVLLEKEALGPNWRFGADGRLGWASAREEALDLLADSGLEDSPVRVEEFMRDLVRDRFGKCLVLVANDPQGGNRRLARLSTGERLPHISLEIWVVYDRPEVPGRQSFPIITGAEMRLIERHAGQFRLVPW